MLIPTVPQPMWLASVIGYHDKIGWFGIQPKTENVNMSNGICAQGDFSNTTFK